MTHLSTVLRYSHRVTHSHDFHCDDELWIAATLAAGVEGRTITDVLTAALRRLVAGTASDADAAALVQRRGRMALEGVAAHLENLFPGDQPGRTGNTDQWLILAYEAATRQGDQEAAQDLL